MSTGVPNLNPGSSHPNHPNHPSQLKGHAKYVKGVTNATIGKMTGSESWAASGTQDKLQGTAEMRAAKERTDPQRFANEYPQRPADGLKKEGGVEQTLETRDANKRL